MKLTPNISIMNALLRITCGFTCLTWAGAKLAKKPWNNSYLIVAMLSGMKIGEGILRYCPVTDMVEEGLEKKMDSNESEFLPNRH